MTGRVLKAIEIQNRIAKWNCFWNLCLRSPDYHYEEVY